MSKLHYTESGQGKPLILLHSGGMTGMEWAPQIESLSQDFRVVVPDQLGHGRSPMIAEKLTISDIGREVVILMNELGIDKAHILGSSLGGAVALWTTVHHPERVDRLVLFRVGYYKEYYTYAGTRDFADPDYWRSVGLHGWLSDVHEPQGGSEAWKTVIARPSEALDPVTSDHAHNLEILSRITQPTLVIVGDRDPLVPLDQALEMFESIPEACLWVLPYATHVTATNTWRADCLALEVTRFLLRPITP